MKLNSLKYLLIGVLAILLSTKKANAQAVVFTGLTGNSPAYLTQGATNDVVWGFSVFVPANKTFSPGPVHIRTSNTLNGFVSGNLIRTTAATPSLAVSAPQASYGAAINSTIDINGFPNLTGGTSGTTYYYYLVLSVTVTANPSPASVYFSLPPSSSITQNGFSGGITTNDLATPTTYYFGVNPPTVPAATSCGTAPVTLTASDASPSGGTYAWYTAPTGGLPVATGATYSPSINATTTFYVAYTYGLNTSSRTAAVVTFGALPSSTFTATSSVTCGVNATITYTGGDPATSTYTWNFNGGTVTSGSGQGPYTVQWTTAGTKTITLSVTNANGCTSASGSQSVTVLPYPVPAFSYATPNVYYVGSAITPLPPVTTGGPVGTYGAATNVQTVNNSNGIAIDPATGYRYITSVSGNTGAIYNSSGTLLYTQTGYNSPEGIILDASGSTYVANGGAGTVIKTTTAGVKTTITGFSGPTALTMDAAGNIYVVDRTAGSIYKINASSTTAGTAYITGLSQPWGITVNTTGDLYISEPGPSNSINTIFKVPAGSTTPSTFVSTGLSSPRNMVVDGAGNIFEADAGSGSINMISPSGTVTVIATGLDSPVGIALDASGNIYATGYNFGEIYKIVASGYTISPALPAGLYFNAYSGSITGTPTAVSAATNYTITGTNNGGSSTAVVNITVTMVTIASSGNPGCGSGSVTLTGAGGLPSGGTYNWYSSLGGSIMATGNTFAPIVSGSYYATYTSGTVTSPLSAASAVTINPIVTAPYSGAFFSYPFSGNTNDVSSYGNNGSNNAATLTTDRYGSANAAYSFNGSSSYITDPFIDNNPTSYTISIWFNTTTTNGGALIGLQNGSYYVDRVLYMANNGQLYWGLYPGSVQTINTTLSYNDGNWHHAVVTVSSSGSVLYVDGTAKASSTAMTVANGVNGYWTMGYDILTGWSNVPTNNYFTGKLDDIAVYHRVLSSSEIGSSNDINQIYVGSATTCSALTFNAPTITGATYTWTDPNNATQTGQSVSFPGAVAGNYTLTVTGGPGGCSSTTTITPTVYTSTSAAFNVPASIPVSTNTTVSLFSGVGSSTYSWNFGGGTSSSGTTGQGPFAVQWSTTGVKTITLTVTTSGGCVTVTKHNITVTSSTYGNYTYSRTITMNNAAVGMSANVTSFPVLITIQNNDLIVSGNCNDKIQNPTSNYDFAFFDPSAPSELNYQVESYNSTTGTLLVWVRVPTMYAATNNTLTFCYGAKVPAVTHDATFYANTWNADYQAVYHFNETAYNPTTADGTVNGRTATLAGFQTTDYVAAGKIGSCYTFGGTSGSSSANDMEAPAVAPSSTFTLSAWINTSNNNVDEKVLTDQNASGTASGGYKLGVYYGSAETEADYYINRGSNTPAEPTPLSTGTWYYVQGVYDGTTMSTYVNGVQYKKYAVTSTSTFTNTLFIGIGESKSYPFAGMIDDARVSSVAKSSDWIKLEYVNQNNPSAFITVSTNATACNTTNGSAIPGEITYTWTGATSTDPSVASNWNNTATATSALPAFDGSASLVIPAGLAKYPALTAPISVYGLTIANGAQLNLNGNILSIGCHIYNGSGGQILYGTTSTAGGITFNGSLTTQYYYGTSTGITNVANLTVNNSAGGTVTITGGAFGVNNMLTLTNGNLLIDNAGSGSLTLLSSATNSASVAAIPTGFTITGNVNVQRYLTNGTGTRGYRLLSSPVNVNSSTTGANTNTGLTYLNTNATFNSTTYYGAYTQGPGTGFNLNGSAHPIIYLYDETQATNNRSFTGGKNIGIYSITGSSGSPAYGVITQGTTVASSAINLPTATSYLLYFVGSNQSTSVATSRVPDATTLTATGYLNQGTIPFKFWKTGSASLPYDVTSGTTNYGIFQVGNPYPSTINLATLFTDNYVAGSNAIGSAFYELIPAGNYVTYNASNGAVSDLRASKYIVSGQGFLAQTTAAGQTITFKEDQKTTYSSAATLLESINSPALADAHTINSMPASKGQSRNDALQVSANAINAVLHVQLTRDSANYAQTGIYYKNTAADKYIPAEDAVEIDGGTPQVFLSSYSDDNVKLAINTLGDYSQSKRVRLYANANFSGTYTLSLADLSGIDTANYSIYLIDSKQPDSLDLVHNKTYTFTLNTGDTTTFGSNRFVLAIEHKAVKDYKLATFTGAKVSTGVQLNWTAINAGNYTGYTLQKLNANGGYDSLYSVQSDAAITNYNYIDTHPIIGNNTYRLAQNGITGAITFSAAVTIGYNSSTPNGALTVYPNPAQSIINVSIPSSTISSPNYVADIYNSAGQIVNHQSVTNSKWTSNVSSYKLGVYVLQVKDTNGNIVGVAKFMKVD